MTYYTKRGPVCATSMIAVIGLGIIFMSRSSTDAQAASEMRTHSSLTHDYIGFVYPQDAADYDLLLQQQDYVAARKLWLDAEYRGQATRLERGVSYIEMKETMHGRVRHLVCLRRKGNPNCAWVGSFNLLGY